MSEVKVSRRSGGEDAIDFVVAKNRYVGSVSLGNGPDGKRIRRKEGRPLRRYYRLTDGVERARIALA